VVCADQCKSCAPNFFAGTWGKPDFFWEKKFGVSNPGLYLLKLVGKVIWRVTNPSINSKNFHFVGYFIVEGVDGFLSLPPSLGPTVIVFVRCKIIGFLRGKVFSRKGHFPAKVFSFSRFSQFSRRKVFSFLLHLAQIAINNSRLGAVKHTDSSEIRTVVK
jgi:hypothetical protein